MFKPKSILIITLLLIAGFSYSQTGPKIKFESKRFDFGTIKEDDGAAKCTFHFTNTGDEPLKLTKVKPGCGCTTSEWTKEEIMPGGKGFISAVYNPKNRPGPFNKAISVETNDPKQSRIILFISGKVTPRKKTTIDFYPVKAGNLRFKTNHLAFMDIKNGESKTDTMKLYNVWHSSMTIKLKNVPEFITYKIIPQTLKPKQEGVIIMTYNTKKKEDFGLVFDRFSMETNDSLNPIKPMTVSAKIVESFSHLTQEQLNNAPILKFDQKEYDFGVVESGTTVTHTFNYTNIGKNELEIRKVSPNAGCTVKSKGKSPLKSGELSQITVSVNTRGRAGNIHKTITVISNDPRQPTITLNVTGRVSPKK
jgi:hypothetical protein